MYDDDVHFFTDGSYKYIWYTQTGREQLFDLNADPQELYGFSPSEDPDEILQPWRRKLAQRLQNRPEGFSVGERLIVGQPHYHLVPNPPQEQ